MNRLWPWLGLAGLVVFVAALVGFGGALAGYSQVSHPVAVLGAKGIPHALAFNLIAFVVPGMLAGMVTMELRQRLPRNASWPLRVGTQLAFLSALGFIALGLLPLDPEDLHNDASSLHATAWMLWWVAFVPGALMLAAGLRGREGWHGLAWSSAVAAAMTLATVLFAVDVLPAGVAQRLAFGVWLLWLCAAARR